MKGKTMGELHRACDFIDKLRDEDFETYKGSIHYRIKCLPHLIELDWEKRTVVFHVYPGNCTDMEGACSEAAKIMGIVRDVFVFDGSYLVNRYSLRDGEWRCMHQPRKGIDWGSQ